MEYPSIRGEELPYYAKKDTWNLWHAYIGAHSQRSIDECPVYGLQAISSLKYQYENITFDGQSRFNIQSHKVVQKGEESSINYIKIFQNAKVSENSVGDSYTKD